MTTPLRLRKNISSPTLHKSWCAYVNLRSVQFPVLQIALDLDELVKTVDIATNVVSKTTCSRLWMEVGTPLLKAWGKIAIRSLKDLTKCFIVADTKAVDVPGLEAKIVYSAGADAFTVLGVADDDTIREAASAARDYGRSFIVDMIGCRDPFSRSLEIARFEPDVILLHVGISVQRTRGVTAEALADEAVRVKEQLGVRVAIAGGLKPGKINPLVAKGVDVIVVGSAITSAQDPASVTLEILREMGISTQV